MQRSCGGKAPLALLAALATLIWAVQVLAPAPASAWQAECSESVCNGDNPGGGSSDPSDPWPWEGDPSGPNPGTGDGNIDLHDEHSEDAGLDDHSYERPEEEPADYRGYETTDPKDGEEPGNFDGYETTDQKVDGGGVVDPDSVFKDLDDDDDDAFKYRPNETIDEKEDRWFTERCRIIRRRYVKVLRNGRDLADILSRPIVGTKEEVLDTLMDQYFGENCGGTLPRTRR
jgi:hypothetical protein